MKRLFFFTLVMLSIQLGFSQVLTFDGQNAQLNMQQNQKLLDIQRRLIEQSAILEDVVHIGLLDLYVTDSTAHEKFNTDRLTELYIANDYDLEDYGITPLPFGDQIDVDSKEMHDFYFQTEVNIEKSSDDIMEALDKRIAYERDLKKQALRMAALCEAQARVEIQNAQQLREHVMDAGRYSMTEGERIQALTDAKAMESRAYELMERAHTLKREAIELSELEQFKLQMESAVHTGEVRTRTFKNLIPGYKN